KIEKGEKFPIATDYGNWWRVLYSDQVGYVHKDSVKAEFKNGDNYFRVYKDDLPVYENEKGYLMKIGELDKGQVFPIATDYGNWWRINFGDSFGYVRKSNTGYATKKEMRNINKNYVNSEKKFLVLNNNSVVDNSSGELVPFGELEKGVIYPIAEDYGNWWRIIYLGRVGFVKKSEVIEYKLKSLDELIEEYKVKGNSDSASRVKLFYTNPNENYISIANNMLNDIFTISSYGTFDFSNGIPWGESPLMGEEMSRSYYRALHAQFFLNDLVAAYKENHNKEYIQKGFEIIEDWISNNPYGNSRHELSWHDEASARRLVTWINFFDTAKSILNKEQVRLLFVSMSEHADLLVSDAFHTTHTNHGMFQDEALIAFGDYFNEFSKEQLYSVVGKTRLKDYFNHIVSREGVHLEHSPGYHLTIAKSVKRYRDFFSALNDLNQYEYYDKLYNRMANYYVWVIKPDGTLPLIGDTFKNVKPPTNLWEDNPFYRYSLTQGREGLRPEKTSEVYKDAGYAIFRDDWEKGKDATYIHFTAAYHTDYHKHSDDLSVWIYTKGHDLITEAGPNGYDYDLPFTEFGYSSYAHNTLIVNDAGLPRTDGKYDSTYLTDFYIDDNLSSVTGVNRRYEDVEHNRNLKYNKNSQAVTVTDTIKSSKENNYKLLWNLAEGVVPQINGNQIRLLIDGKEVASMEISSSSKFSIKDVNGQTSPEILGWHLDNGKEPTKTHAIVIEAQEKDAEIVTTFHL
ncbi:alginate lyase family protein, partial [Sediminibacillus terrae]|uniref:alginate lyase family protein n=1 Tax=Sediminibacillus terrae TaxID=1562106 RepID=UPI00192A19C1